MSIIEGLMLPRAFELQERIHNYLDGNTDRRSEQVDWTETDLIAVEDRIGHLTSLLVF